MWEDATKNTTKCRLKRNAIDPLRVIYMNIMIYDLIFWVSLIQVKMQDFVWQNTSQLTKATCCPVISVATISLILSFIWTI